jgi:hypothetical protein
MLILFGLAERLALNEVGLYYQECGFLGINVTFGRDILVFRERPNCSGDVLGE